MAIRYVKSYAALKSMIAALRFLRRFTWKRWLAVYAGIGLFAASPLISILIAWIWASLVGCGVVTEASAPDCPGGEYIGILFIAGWLALFTIPVGFLLFLVAVAFTLLWLLQRAIIQKAAERGYTGGTAQ
jgi:hypothetical protein